MGTGFSYRYDDTYKSPRELIHLLIDVVAKGGNLALNVAPGSDGRLPKLSNRSSTSRPDALCRSAPRKMPLLSTSHPISRLMRMLTHSPFRGNPKDLV